MTARRNARYTPLDADGPLPLDMLRAIPAIRRDPLTFLEHMVARHGNRVAFPAPRGAVLLLDDPAAVRHVLVANHRGYSKDTVQYRALSLVTGQGLLTSDGDLWRSRRSVARPAFHHSGLAGVAAAAVRAAADLRASWDAAPDGVLDADAATLRHTLDVVGVALFDADLREVGARVVHAVDAALRVVIARAQSPVPGSWPTPSRRRLRRAVTTLDGVCADVVLRRRRSGVGESDSDLLGLLLRAGGAGLVDERAVRDELVTAVIAGHETVASCLTWALHLLAGAPQVQDRLAAELDGVLGGRAPSEGDLAALTYTRAVVDEALRLYPPAWVVTRRAREDDVLGDLAVPAGTLVIMSPWLLHRRPSAWPDPLRFDPERFLPAAGGSEAARYTARGEYLPFGAGPRLCIGRDMALVEAVLVLAGLLRNRRVERPGAGHARAVRAGAGVRSDVQVDALVTLRPRGGLPLRLLPR